MTKEDKDLLLKDIYARIPYGVEGCCEDETFRTTPLHWYAEYEVGYSINYMIIKSGWRPYLFPLSSMTLEQRCKVQNLLPNKCEISFKNQKITFYDEGNIQLEQLEKIFHFFNLWHIDYRGLIPMGLALDATGLNIYKNND